MASNHEVFVISGISGRYPEASNFEDFWDKLINKVPLYSSDDRRWPIELLSLPKFFGKVDGLHKMDATFFGVTNTDANYMDPQVRILHEVVYEAIWDAGIDPYTLRGTRTGFFLGACYDDTATASREDDTKQIPYWQLSAMRISYAFDLKGPVSLIDTACASSFSGLHVAVSSLKSGTCDRAIVCGSALHLRPLLAKAFHSLNMLSTDGLSKCLDKDADGYQRSEAIVALLLEKESNCKRIYARILNVKTNTDGYKPEGITFPKYSLQHQLMVEIYRETQVDPLSIEYVEAHITGTKAGDPVESKAILDALRPNSSKPILFGCLKSNMGHTEGASAVCSISKVAKIFQKGMIPPNMNFKEANPNIEGLVKGIIKPVLEKTPFDQDLIGVNSFGFGGVNVHAILQANPRRETKESYQIATEIPRLIHVCNRTREGINFTFQQFESVTLTREQLRLLHDVSKIEPTVGMKARGMMIVDGKGESLKKSCRELDKKRPLWYILAPLGSQWQSMGLQLRSIPTCWQSICQCHEVVKSFGYDLIDIICENREIKDIVEAVLAITSIQIALIDLMEFLGIKPDGIIGHSIGEVAAGYADGCASREQALRTSYLIGKISEEHKSGRGLMAAVGFSWSEAKRRCPSQVEPACNNSSDIVTVGGSYEKVLALLDQVGKEDLLAKEIACCDIAFHCSNVSNAFQPLKRELEAVFESPKQRTKRWVSCSVPEGKQKCPNFTNLTADYYANMVVAPVDFLSAVQQIPKDAAIVELGPSSILLGLLRKQIGSSAVYIAPMKRDSTENVVNILAAIGEIYMAGFWPHIDRLYPKVDYPVARETASIGHLIKWDHSQDWHACKYPEYFNDAKFRRETSFDCMSRTWRFLCDHVVDGRNLFPATGYLYLLWQTVAYLHCGHPDAFEMPIIMKNVHLKRATLISPPALVKFRFEVNQRTKRFEIIQGGSSVFVGYYEIPEDVPDYKRLIHEHEEHLKDRNPEASILEGKDVYKELRVRGYDYGPAFQGIINAKSDGTKAEVKLLDHWISFADSCLQASILAKKSRQLMVPTYFEYLRCDPDVLFNALDRAKESTGTSSLTVHFDPFTKNGLTMGFMMKGMRASLAGRRLNYSNLVVENCQFVPYNDLMIASDISLLKTVHEYQDICNQYLECLIREEKADQRPSEDILKKYLDNTTSEKYNLLKMIDSVGKSLDQSHQPEPATPFEGDLRQRLKRAMDSEKFALTKDLIVSHEPDTVFRHFIDVISENMTTKTAIVTELNFSCDVQFEKVSYLLLASGARHQAYQLIHQEPENPALAVLPVSSFRYNPELSKIADIKNSNLLILVDSRMSFCPSELHDIRDSIRVSAGLVKEQGFLLIKYRLRPTRMEEKMYTFLGTCWPTLDEDLDYGKLDTLYEELGFVRVSEKVINNGETMYLLLRRTPEEPPQDPIVIPVKRNDYNWIGEVKKAVLDSKSQRRIWLTSIGDPFNGIVGLVNCLKKEPGLGNLRAIYSPNNGTLDHYLTQDLMKKDLVMNLFDENRVLGSLRYIKLASTPQPDKLSAHVYMEVLTRGDLTSLHWIQTPHDVLMNSENSYQVADDKEFIRAYYSALNFKDVMVASGRVNLDAYPEAYQSGSLLGMEFSGITMDNRRVLGLCKSMGIATSIVADSKDFTFPVPDSWTLEEACTVPVVYITCYYAFFIRGNLQPGESVLIHSGAGGVGQAAINICLRRNCQVFTTVGTQEKRDFLKTKFPQLDDRHIGDSRSTSFEQLIMRETNGRGVDLVLNSLADDKLEASFRCLAESGRFIEIGKYDLIQDSPLDPHWLDNNKTYEVACVAHLMEDSVACESIYSKRRWQSVREMFLRGLENGEVRPLPRTIFEKDQVEAAFRYMATGKHLGKVLIRIRDEIAEPLPVDTLMPCVAQTFFCPNKSYIITGGLGGVGLELAYWLALRGANKLVLTSRTGVKTAYQKETLENIKNVELFRSVEIVISKSTAMSYGSAAQLIEEAEALGPVGGIFNLAMVLNDAILENQKVETFETVCAPKVLTSVYLDKVAREACPKLDYFVCFSSAASGKGNAGQSNYGFANSVMERVCEKRRRDGHPGLAIQWGAIGDVGIVAEQLGGNDVVLGGTVPQRINSCMEVLDRFLQSSYAVCSSIVMADSKKSMAGSGENLLKTIFHILGVDPSNLDPASTLSDLGMDSLMAVEIKQGLERDYDVIMSTQALRNMTVRELQQLGNQITAKQGTDVSKSCNSNLQTISDMFKPPTELFTPLTDQRGPPLLFFPPIEGNFARLKPLAELLQAPIVGVNWTTELDQFTELESVISFYADAIIKEYPNHNSFTFIGYSFGGLIALLVAIELQEKMEHVRVQKLGLLDSSPELLRAAITELMKRGQLVAEEEAYVELLVGMACTITSIENDHKLRESLLGVSGREMKIKKLGELIGNQGVEYCDANLVGLAADRYFKKMKMVYLMKQVRKFSGDVLLIKSQENFFKTMDDQFEGDFGLSKIVSGKVDVITMKGDHKSFLHQNYEEIAAQIDAKILNLITIA